MTFKETCQKVKTAIKEDLKKKGPYEMSDEDFKQAWKDIGKFFTKGAQKAVKAFSCGPKAKEANTQSLSAMQDKSR